MGPLILTITERDGRAQAWAGILLVSFIRIDAMPLDIESSQALAWIAGEWS